VHSGETVAFMGDSITAGGASSPSGYVRLVESGLEAIGVPVKVIPAGISGHKSNQMLERLERDVLSKKPNWMTLSCGVNDVWHGERGVPLDEYKKNITEILDRCQKAGVKVVVLTSTQIQLPVDNPNNTKLIAYNDFLRKIAGERNLPLADLNAAMLEEQKALAAAGKNRSLTTDGVHMNVFGNLMMARGVMRALGVDASQLATAQAKWQGLPEAVQVSIPVKVSISEYETLDGAAAAQKKTVETMLGEQAKASLKSLLGKP
jgi:lysophospholipase L1-like esterase